MQVLLAQVAPEPGDVAANVAAVARVLAQHPAAELAVFPELFLTGYDPPTAATRALAVGDPALEPLVEAARRHRTAIIVGFAERLGREVANAVSCIGPDGAWQGCYRKTHLFGPAEWSHFAAGNDLLIADLGDGVRAGLLVCFDMEFPEPARALSQAGATLLVTTAANMEPFGPDHPLAARARAFDNRRPHIYVNRVGEESGHRFVGGSLVTDAGGNWPPCTRPPTSSPRSSAPRPCQRPGDSPRPA